MLKFMKSTVDFSDTKPAFTLQFIARVSCYYYPRRVKNKTLNEGRTLDYRTGR